MAGDVDEQSAANEGSSEKDHGSAGERRYRILSGNTGLSVTERRPEYRLSLIHILAEKIGVKHLKVLEPKENSLMKLVTFVPISHADIVRNALFAAGCGNIGNYDSCSYNLEGEGT